MPERGRSELRVCEGKIEGRTSSGPLTPCLHIGFCGAKATEVGAATGATILSTLAVLRRSPARLRRSFRVRRS
jgi:hypothetical protein